MRTYYVYILASATRTLYTGMTNDLTRRIREHTSKSGSGFTVRYNVNRLVYYEVFGDVRDAIKREKQIKGWRRSKKIELIETHNPNWEELRAR